MPKNTANKKMTKMAKDQSEDNNKILNKLTDVQKIRRKNNKTKKR